MSPRRAHGGFTLLEVLVALAVLEVGMLAAAGTLLLAARILAEAALVERAAADAAALADSLLAAPDGVGGEAVRPGYTLAWEPRGGGWRIRAVAGDRALVDVTAP